jgi:hypothetical protein
MAFRHEDGSKWPAPCGPGPPTTPGSRQEIRPRKGPTPRAHRHVRPRHDGFADRGRVRAGPPGPVMAARLGVVAPGPGASATPRDDPRDRPRHGRVGESGGTPASASCAPFRRRPLASSGRLPGGRRYCPTAGAAARPARALGDALPSSGCHVTGVPASCQTHEAGLRKCEARPRGRSLGGGGPRGGGSPRIGVALQARHPSNGVVACRPLAAKPVG